MATDLGTKSARTLPSGLTRGGSVSFPGQTFTEFDLGTFAVRSLGGGGGEATFIDRTLYMEAPAPTDGSGDHGISAFRDVLPVENTSQTEPYPETLYVVPAGCRLFIIEYELYNDTPSPQTPKLYFGQYPVHTTEIPAWGAVLQPTRKILQGGMEIEGSGPSPANALVDNPGVWCWITAILEVP